MSSTLPTSLQPIDIRTFSLRETLVGQHQPFAYDRYEVTSVTTTSFDLLKTPAPASRNLRWLCAIVSACVSVGLATWSALGLSHLGLSPSVAFGVAVRGAPTMMLWFLPLWLPELAFGVVAPASRWLRLICGAIGVGIGVALIIGLAAARANETFLVALALTYLVLGAFNCWFGVRSRRSSR